MLQRILDGLKEHTSVTKAWNNDILWCTSIDKGIEILIHDAMVRSFEKVGDGTLTLTSDSFALSGVPGIEEPELVIPTASFAALPYKPGKHIEVQHGETIYRCLPEDGRLVIKFINMIKIFYEINTAEAEKKKAGAAVAE